MPSRANFYPDLPDSEEHVVVANQRRLPRDRIAIPCELIHGPWGERAQGVVRDLHDEGARIRCASTAIASDLVEISFSGQSRKGAVVWRSRWEIGVKFAQPNNDVADDQIRALREKLRQMRGS